MLLQSLVEYSHRLSFNLPPTLYSELAVRYIIELGKDGHYFGIIDTADPSTPRTKRGQPRLVPEVTRAAGVRALLLCDKSDYVLGYVAQDGKPDRVADCHTAYVALLKRCAAATEEPNVLAVLKFLENSPLKAMKLPDDFSPADRITFSVNGQFPTDLPSVRAFWAAENDPERAGAQVMQCVICGRMKPVLSRLQGKVKGVPGGQTSGTSMISANAEAFESYGLEASQIAPTCADCGERFTKAANHLLANRESRSVLAGAAFIYWTREEIDFDIFSCVTEPNADKVGALLRTLHGSSPPKIDETRLYAAVLSGSGARTVVRDWIDTTVGEAKRHLALWFQRQAIVDGYGEEPRPLGLAALAGATARELSDVPRPITRSLLRAALTGTPVAAGFALSGSAP